MLTRYDPFREMLAIRNTMERLLDSAMTGTSTLQPATLGLALDVAESENEYVVKASLPGIYLNDLEITYSNNTLTIKGGVREEQELEAARYHLRERSWSGQQELNLRVNPTHIDLLPSSLRRLQGEIARREVEISSGSSRSGE